MIPSLNLEVIKIKEKSLTLRIEEESIAKVEAKIAEKEENIQLVKKALSMIVLPEKNSL